MSISSAMNAGVAGLSSNASRLATISDNIANSGTVGYKRAQSEFHSLVTSSGAGSYTAGGVRVTTSRVIDQAGGLRTTGNATDLAIRGRGFLPVTNESALNNNLRDFPLSLATTGSFRTDKDGFLRSEAGLVLMGWPADANGQIPEFPRDTADGLQPIQINVNQSAGERTNRINLGVNLPATETAADAAGDPLPLPIEYFDNLGTSQTLNIDFTPTVPANPGDPLSNEWTMSISDSASGGALVAEYTITFDPTPAAGGTLVNVVPTGNNPPTADGTNGGAVYDPNTGLLQFGVGLDPADPVNNPPVGGQMVLDIGAIASGTGLTQFSDAFAPTNISKDGAPVGNMTSVEVDTNGYVRANFDTGITKVVYQIPLIDLPNPNGLIAGDNQTYTVSEDSGSMFLWDAGDGPTGDVISYALEESATDVAAELTSLITTQRAYSSNAKVIQTVDEMLQETTNIKR